VTLISFKQIQTRSDVRGYLVIAAIIFLFLFSVVLTLSPAVRLRSWQVNYSWTHWIGFILWLAGFYWFVRIAGKQEHLKDSLLVPITGLLCGWGILSIWRLSFIFGLRQAAWFLGCVFLSSLMLNRPWLLETAKKYKYVLLFLGLLLAGLTFIFGTYPGGDGPRLWLGLRGLYFQPSELLKLLLIFYLAAYFSESRSDGFKIINSILPALALFTVSMILLVAQRDLGTSLIFIVIFIFMLFVKYGKRRVILFGALFLLIAAVIGYLTIDLVKIRFQGWVLPWLDPQAGSYQIIQSLIAIAAGGITGTGVGLGSPRAIPIAHSDFIYSAMVEETGLFGAIALLLLFGLGFSRGIRLAVNTDNKYHQHLACGISVYLISQAILIIGGNIRLLPITGVTLPFLSYGGSSLLISFASIVVLLIIENQQSNEPVRSMLPFKTTSTLYGFFLGGLLMLSLVTGWWSFVRSRDLQLRTDNPRHASAARYVKRGTIFDRNDRVLAQSVGTIGNFQRQIMYVPLSNTIGFSNGTYGNAGLEARLEDYLSGERGYPAFDMWFNYLLFDQPLPGRDVRLSLDLRIQRAADEMLGNHKGSAVVINAKSGEILAVASHPHFNANEIEEKIKDWQSDNASPLLNRAVQGAYPMGNLITPFILANADQNAVLVNDTYMELLNLFELDACAINLSESNDLRSAAVSGCDSALIQIIGKQDADSFPEIVDQFSLTGSQDIGLPLNLPVSLPADRNWFDFIFGSDHIRVNPLQVAVAASTFSADGVMPSARILSAVNIESEGWVTLGSTENRRVLTGETATWVNGFLKSEAISGWEISANAKDGSGAYSWYLAGTPVSWPGASVVVVIILEEDNAELTQMIGREIYRQATE